jgi:hypothetical protein
MLHWLLHKRRLGSALSPGEADLDDSAWRGITRYEDPLTSAVFSRLEYLDTKTFWALLREACDDSAGARLPEDPPAGAPKWRLWQHLAVGDDGTHARYVEPDAAIEWDHAVLLVEAKHKLPQDAGQWIEQVKAGASHFGGKAAWFIAAGGTNPDHHAENVAKLHEAVAGAPCWFRLRWERLREVVGHPDGGAHTTGTLAILRDITAALDAWGYGPSMPRLGFDTLPAVAEDLRFNLAALDLTPWSTR